MKPTRRKLLWISGAAFALGLGCLAQAQVPVTGAGKGAPGTAGCTSGGTPSTWDPANKSTNIILSGGNLVATSGAGAGSATFVRSTGSHSTGKYYAEFTLTSQASGGSGVALLDGTEIPDTSILGGDIHSIIAFTDGNIYQNNAAIGAIASFTTGDLIGAAVDVGAAKIWFRKGSGAWNGALAGDPTAGSGSLTFTASTPVYFGVRETGPGDVWTANFGATAFSQTVPTCFGNLF